MPSGIRLNQYLDGEEIWHKWHIKGMSLKDIQKEMIAQGKVNPNTRNPPSISGIEKAAFAWAVKTPQNLKKAREDLFYAWRTYGKIVKMGDEDKEWANWLRDVGNLLFYQRPAIHQKFLNQHGL